MKLLVALALLAGVGGLVWWAIVPSDSIAALAPTAPARRETRHVVAPSRAAETRALPPASLAPPTPRLRVDDRSMEVNVSVESRAEPWSEVAGDISGWLRAESGGFAGAAMQRDHVLLDLVSTEHPPIARRASVKTEQSPGGGTQFAFRFADVPAGEYNLTLSSLGNYRWVPNELLVTPPAAGVEFLCYDLDAVLALVFEVFDAQSREPIAVFDARQIKQTNSQAHGVFLHTGPIDDQLFPLDLPFTWSVSAAGYATAYGDEGSFAIESGRRVARVSLERGWSTRFLVMGGAPAARPLAGAEIYLDGVFAGESDGDGALNAWRAQAPTEVAVHFDDWVLAAPIDLAGATAARRSSRVTPLLMKEGP